MSYARGKKRKSSYQNLYGLQAPFHLEKEMGKVLGRSSFLQRPLQKPKGQSLTSLQHRKQLFQFLQPVAKNLLHLFPDEEGIQE